MGWRDRCWAWKQGSSWGTFPYNIPLPDQVATEEQTEDEDEDGCAKNHNVYVERKVLEPDVRHPETVMLEV